VYRKKWVVHIDGMTREKKNGQRIPVPFDASKLAIVQLGEMTADRKALIDKKRASRGVEGKWEAADVTTQA
jgi:large subunit ribosomal protein L26e